MNLRCSLIPNGPTNRSSSGNALSFRAFALVVRRDSGLIFERRGAGWRKITTDDRVTSNGSPSHFGLERFAWFWFSIQRGGHFIRVSEAENSGSNFGLLSETEVRFNWTDSDGDIGDFKCKLIDLSIVHDNRAWVTTIYRIVFFFLQHENKSTGN